MDHDITLRIPEGAVAEGEKIHFEVGVAMYGPFVFPENTQPISPILWLCVVEGDAQLRKPFQIVLPHYLTGLSKEKIEYHQVRFAKANHNDYPDELQISSMCHQTSTGLHWLQKLWCFSIKALLLLLSNYTKKSRTCF